VLLSVTVSCGKGSPPRYYCQQKCSASQVCPGAPVEIFMWPPQTGYGYKCSCCAP